MSLLDDAKHPGHLTGPPCAVTRLELERSPHLAEVLDAIGDLSIPASGIERAAISRGIDGLTAYTVNRHRRNGCANCRLRGRTW